MDIYQDTYESIKAKIADLPGTSKPKVADDIDMYADDFETKELERSKTSSSDSSKPTTTTSEVTWEFKWSQDETDIQDPFPRRKCWNGPRRTTLKTESMCESAAKTQISIQATA